MLRVLVLQSLSDSNLLQILRDAISRVNLSVSASDPDTRPIFSGLPLVTDDVMKYIVTLSVGDARTALNLLELVLQAASGTTTDMVFETLKNTTMSRYGSRIFIPFARLDTKRLPRLDTIDRETTGTI